MNELEFRAGYYEWNVFVNGDCFYTFGDGISEDILEDTTYEDLEGIVDFYIDGMQNDLKDDDKEPLEEKYIPELRKQMLDRWSYHFGIER